VEAGIGKGGAAEPLPCPAHSPPIQLPPDIAERLRGFDYNGECNTSLPLLVTHMLQVMAR